MAFKLDRAVVCLFLIMKKKKIFLIKNDVTWGYIKYRDE
jgi:hypothetical protein